MMLSKTDIYNELGKGISIYPLDIDNIKENSVNLSASEYAWTFCGGIVYYDETEKHLDNMFSIEYSEKRCKKKEIKSKEKAVIDILGKKYIILFPNSTTIIETNETIAIGDNIGGTYHSKVGCVSRGIGYISTMVGPNFCGDSLVALHNPTNEIIALKCGDTFVSVIFYYLKTKYSNGNATVSGHMDKFAAWEIKITDEDLRNLNADWKKSKSKICENMICTEDYKRIKQEIKLQKQKSLINPKNIIISLGIIVVFVFWGFLAEYVDAKTGTHTWGDRFWNVCCSGIVVTIILPVVKYILNNSTPKK